GKMSTIAKTFQIAIYNLLSQPKKTILLLLVAITTLFFVFINYGSKLVAQNMDHYGNGLYNSYPERLVVTRKNKAPLTTTDYDYFMSQSEITKVIIPDLVVDAQFHINFQIKDSYYYEDGFLNFNNDFAHQVVIGRLPQADNEIALAFNPYSIDENNLDKPLNAIYDISISTANGYFQMPYKLVGIYPTTDQSQFILSEGGITKLYDLMKISLKGYQFIVKDGGVEQNLPYGMISVNNSLSEHNIKISLYYKDILPGNLEQAEVSLNNVPVTITFDALTDHYNTIFVSPSFFQELKVDEDYQYTLNLKDKDQANKVINRLFDNGYYAFSPFLASKVIDFDAIFSVITNIFATLGVLFSVAVTFIISYLVVRSILLSKKKDYTILRIIGLKFQELKQVAVLEIITIFLGALLILSGIYITLIIGSYEIRNLVNKTFTFWNYFSLITLSLAVMILIAWRFTRMMTKKSLFMNLKVEGE
ncbi:MAG TPA: hypothetical protein PK087_03390, partial [Bacilli bacterium]|nr:hypothetical protein [Bacilli bacterium]